MELFSGDQDGGRSGGSQPCRRALMDGNVVRALVPLTLVRSPKKRGLTMKPIITTVTLASVLILTGCGTTTGQRTGSGALLGGATGAAIGSFSGNAGKGALIGAGIGAAGGYLYDQDQKARDGRRYDGGRRGRYR